MDFSDFSIRLLIILIPGAIAAIIVETLTIHKKWDQLRLIVSAIILGIGSFALLQVFYWIYQLQYICEPNFLFQELQTWKCMVQKEKELNYNEIIFCLPVSILLGYLLSWFIQRKLIFKIAKIFHVSRKFGDDSLYYHYLNSDEIDWVYVRDKTNGFTYRGQVESFAEDASNKELLLRNVTVFQFDSSAELYKLKQIYLKFNSRDIIIETPA